MSDILSWPTGNLDFTEGCLVMGILNVTPDSFSDGGKFSTVQNAVNHALRMAQQGASIIDIGPESTRPGSLPVSTKEQIDRAVPVIEQLAEHLNIPISIDANKTEVAKAALDAGASVVNDISALSDAGMAELVAQREVPIILMHMQGTPRDMQNAPTYTDVVREVLDYLLERAAHAQNCGIPRERIILDPGIGFGKTQQHNLLLLKNIDAFVASGYRILVGASRKRFIGNLTGKDTPEHRLMGTAATIAHSAAQGANMVRVHDVPEMLDVVKVANAIRSA